MISTSYVPLEHPYRIIEYNGTLGIQIGTLIVTKESEKEDEGYAVETHSHPVVSYVNNHAPKIKNDIPFRIIYNTVEGVVWDRVEVHEVNTIVREDEVLKWDNFMNFCRERGRIAIQNRSNPWVIEVVKAWGQIVDWGVPIQHPTADENGLIVLKVLLEDEVVGAKAYCLGRGDLGLIVPLVGVNDMYKTIDRQVFVYKTLLKQFSIDGEILVIFSTKEERYKKLVSMLNGEKLTDAEETEQFAKVAEDIVKPDLNKG